mgnify:CR=1 FL=1
MVTASVPLAVLPKGSRFGFHATKEFLNVTQNQSVFLHLEECLQAQVSTDKCVNFRDFGQGAVAVGREEEVSPEKAVGLQQKLSPAAVLLSTLAFI